jgi:hypothetical protein
MSATPRPWKWSGRALRSRDGSPVLDINLPAEAASFVMSQEDADFIATAVNAFDALLAAAKSGHSHPGYDERCGGCAALAALDAAHPGWREWTA